MKGHNYFVMARYFASIDVAYSSKSREPLSPGSADDDEETQISSRGYKQYKVHLHINKKVMCE